MSVNELTSYRSLAKYGESGEMVINKSRFYGYSAMTLDEEDALSFIQQVRNMHPDASVICYGYICGLSGQIQRFHDGHEPVGGMPILDVLKSQHLVAATCVVVRYFGGIKLGMGGLARAFSNAAAKAVQDGLPSTYESGHMYSLSIDYAHNDRIQYWLSHSTYNVGEWTYTDRVQVELMIKDHMLDTFKDELNSITLGQHQLQQGAQKYTC